MISYQLFDYIIYVQELHNIQCSQYLSYDIHLYYRRISLHRFRRKLCEILLHIIHCRLVDEIDQWLEKTISICYINQLHSFLIDQREILVEAIILEGIIVTDKSGYGSLDRIL